MYGKILSVIYILNSRSDLITLGQTSPENSILLLKSGHIATSFTSLFPRKLLYFLGFISSI